MHNRNGLKWLLAMIWTLAAIGAQAQPYPSRPLTMILPFGAGGTSDVLMRMIAPDLGKAFGQSVIIDHKVGRSEEHTSELQSH